MVLTMMPALGKTTEVSAEDEKFSRILNVANTIPNGYNESDTSNPYMKVKDRSFLLNKQDELLLYTQWDDGGTTMGTVQQNIMDTYYPYNKEKGRTTTVPKDTDSYKESNSVAASPTMEDPKKSTDLNWMAYVTGIAFDPKGTGHKDHVAYVGLNTAQNAIMTWVLDTTTKTYSEPAVVNEGITTNWIHLTEYAAHAFFSITAGDYDNDGCDTFIVYSPGANEVNPNLLEYKLSATISAETGKYPLELIKTINIDNPFIVENVKHSPQDGSNYYMRTMSLATGDFDGDCVDEIAAAVGTYKLNSSQWADKATYCTRISVFNESNNNFTTAYQTDLADTKTSGTSTTTYQMIYAGGIASGDVNADGIDEIVAAGYTGTATVTYGDKTTWSDLYNRDRNNFGISTVYYNSSTSAYGRYEITLTNMNAYTSGHTGDEAGKVTWPMPVPKCVSINGDSAADSLFLAGTLYDWSEGGLTPAYTPEFFNSKYDKYNSVTDNIQDHWIEYAAVGNFDGNQVGRQQVMFIAAFKIIGAEDYYFKIGVIGGASYDDKYRDKEKTILQSYGTVSSYYCSTMDEAANLFAVGAERGNSWWDKDYKILNAAIVAVDDDNDGVKAKYVSKGYEYTDPQVLSVLQAAPYFGELNDYADFTNGGQTSYSVTTSYTYGKTTSQNVSFGVGFAGSVNASVGLGLQVSLEAGYTLDWSKSYEHSLTTEYTSTFTAGPYDLVILERIPVIVYNYQLLNTDYGTWSGTYQCTVPLEPVYSKLTVDEYNNFVIYYADWYKTNITEKTGINDQKVLLKNINDYLPADNEGDPTVYRSDWGARTINNVSDHAVQLSKATYEIGHGGGTTTSEWNQESSYQKGVEFQHGFHFSLTAQGGPAVAGNGVMGGAYVNLDYSRGAGHYTTDTKAQGASGTVPDIDSEALAKAGIPADISGEYGFSWNFGMWEWDLGGKKVDFTGLVDANQQSISDGNPIFFGYAVNNITRPSAAVTNLSAQLASDNSATLTWSAPDNTNRPDITGYCIYLVNTDGTYTKKATTDSTVNAYTVTGLDLSNTDYTFVVASLYNSSLNRSLYSNEATVTTPKRLYTLTYSGNADITAIYTGSNGNVSSGDSCPEDTVVYFTANAHDGYALTGYKVQFGTDPEATYTFDSCQKKEFNFRFPSNTVTVTVLTKMVESDITFQPNNPAEGNVTAFVGNTEISSGGGTVTDVVTITAVPSGDNVLLGWLVTEIDEQGNSGTPVFISDDGSKQLVLNPVKPGYSITANFAQPTDPDAQKKVTISELHYGSIEIRDADGTILIPNNSNQITAELNSHLTFTAVPVKLYSLKGWTGDISGTTNPITVKVSKDMVVGADFNAPVMYRVAFSADPAAGGSVSALNNGTTLNTGTAVANGSVISFSAAANTTGGSVYAFNGWKVNQASNDSAADALSLTIASKTEVVADFIETYTITANAGSGGTITPSGKTTLKKGEDISYHIVPDYGYAIEDVQVDRVSVGPLSNYSFSGVSENHSITATFEETSTPAPNPGPGGGDETPGTKTSERVSGGTRYDTMSSAITKAFEDGSSTVILASGGNWPDALAASSLAGAMECPVILTEQGQLTSQTADLISSLKATDVIIVGGTAAVSDDVKSTIESKEIKVNRIFGNDRTLTADAIEGEVMKYSTTDTVIICSGQNFPDALSISPYAYAQKIPILLTGNNGKLTDASLAIAKGFRNAILVGKEGAVSKDVETQLPDVSLKRYGGNERYGTSVEIINNLFGGKPSALAVATGEDYPDALVGATLAGKSGGALLLVNGMGTSLTDSQKTIIGNADSVWVLGGDRVVSDAMKTAIDDALK